MRCLTPIDVKNKSIGGFSTVPCGKCLACLKERARNWALRVSHEAETVEKSCFVTLTYSTPNLPLDGSVHKSELQLFFKRLRKAGLSFRYFACGEYGDRFGRPHYHSIFFGVDFSSPSERLVLDGAWINVDTKVPLGFVTVAPVNMARACYVASYVVKKSLEKKAEGLEPEFVLMSRRPGIGFDYYAMYWEFLLENGFVYMNGVKVGLPRYYLNKIKEVKELSLSADTVRFAKEMNFLLKMRRDLIQRTELDAKVGKGDLHRYREDIEKGRRKRFEDMLQRRKSLCMV